MGEVYRARDSRLQRKVSIKVLPEAVRGDPDRLARFEREAQTASNLNHPNLLTIFKIGEDGGTRFIAAELVEGETLRARLGRGPLPVAEVVELAEQIATGVAAAHEAGIVHRDLKPDNVMIRPDGIVKVLDFGLAKSVERPLADSHLATLPQTAAGTIAGTLTYMSPEQARGLAVDARSDVFSLGAILYSRCDGLPRRSDPGGAGRPSGPDDRASVRVGRPRLRRRVARPSPATRLIGRILPSSRDELTPGTSTRQYVEVRGIDPCPTPERTCPRERSIS
jgi:serine/threonine protein kinase